MAGAHEGTDLASQKCALLPFSAEHAWDPQGPLRGAGAHGAVGCLGGGRGRRPYLLGLLQQLHALPQDLAVELAALPQDLPAHLLHGRLQVLPLALAQRLARLPARLLLQRRVQRGLQVLDFLSGPNHTDR